MRTEPLQVLLCATYSEKESIKFMKYGTPLSDHGPSYLQNRDEVTPCQLPLCDPLLSSTCTFFCFPIYKDNLSSPAIFVRIWFGLVF